MQSESKKEILERRKEIEEDIVMMLGETNSEFTLQDVKEAIYNEEDEDDMTDIMAMFDRGGDASELENILDLVTDVWNYFPHKILGGVSPQEKIYEYHKKESLDDSKEQSISLTKQQFFALMKLAYLGNWMANAIHTGSKEDSKDEELDKMEDYINSFADTFGFGEYIDEDKELQGYFPTRDFDDLLQQYIDTYDDNCFWDELFYRISNRDFKRKYTEKEIKNMELSELFEKQEPFREKWDNEFNMHGIDRLEIDDV